MMHKPIYVAELTVNHLGMVNIAKQMIYSAKNIGVNYVKLKLKNVDAYYQDDNKHWRNFNFKLYRSSLELSHDDFQEIDRFCKEINMSWFCTVHDYEGLDFIKQFDLPFYKVASVDAGNEEFVETVLRLCQERDKPMIISIGGKTDEFTQQLINKINDYGIQAYILHTVSIYPTPLGKSNINYIDVLKEKYENDRIKVGYSGHEVGYAPSVLAVRKGVHLLERHFTLSKDLKIHHIKCALTPTEFQTMINIINDLTIEESESVKDYYEEEMSFLQNQEYV